LAEDDARPVYIATQGNEAMAHKELERILAEDSSYACVGEQLAELIA
jgi:hypothetical protein